MNNAGLLKRSIYSDFLHIFTISYSDFFPQEKVNLGGLD